MKKRKAITFEMEEESDISNQIIVIDENCYTRLVRTIANVRRFSIPVGIKYELNLNAGDDVYFIKSTEGYYVSFKKLPEDASKRNYRSRKLIKAGAHDTLYLAIPQFITHAEKKDINCVQLLRPKGWQAHEWIIRFLSIECT